MQTIDRPVELHGGGEGEAFPYEDVIFK